MSLRKEYIVVLTFYAGKKLSQVRRNTFATSAEEAKAKMYQNIASSYLRYGPVEVIDCYEK